MTSFIIKLFKAGLVVVATFVFFISWLFISLPNVSFLKNHNPQRTRFMEIYYDKAIQEEKFGGVSYFWLPYEKISPNLRQAVVVAEDDTFFAHNGFDWKALKLALTRNLRDRAFTRGGSTITQQLVKNIYLTPDKNPFRKMREWIITYQMEKTLSKRRILELYLNVVEWGEGIYGAEAAARHYFSKSAASLDPSQAAYLAAILPNPQLFTKKHYSRTVVRRKSRILARMNGYKK